jgi:hypothetical protein
MHRIKPTKPYNKIWWLFVGLINMDHFLYRIVMNTRGFCIDYLLLVGSRDSRTQFATSGHTYTRL